MINQLKILTLFTLISIIPGCAFQTRYHNENSQLSQSQTCANVTLQADILTDEQTSATFKKNLRNNDYQPIAIRIFNRTANTLLFRSSYTNLPLIAPDIIAKELHYNVPLTVSGLFVLGYLGFQLFWPLAPFMITAFPMGWQSHKENQKITEQIQRISLPIDERETVEIPPFTSITRYAFVPYEISYQFQFMLFDTDDKKLIPFDVYLYN